MAYTTTTKKLTGHQNHILSYEQYRHVALHFDHINGADIWKKNDESPHYDFKLIRARLDELRELKEAVLNGESPDRLIYTLRSGLLRNLGGITNDELYQISELGTKKLIEDYTNTVVQLLNFICDHVDIPINDKFDFFWETRQAYGRTALLLSGGAMFGLYHIGVLKALHEQNVLPSIISGSSVGSIIASLIAVRTDEELNQIFQLDEIYWEAFDPVGSSMRKIKRLLSKGVIMDIKKLQSMLKKNLGDITFREAYKKTKRILNITISSTGNQDFPRILNYLTAPEVLIWSAVSASCALRFLYEPVELMARDPNGEIRPYFTSILKWSDGSVENDLPMARLAELFNVNHFIVSQVNPHVFPFITINSKKSLYQKIKKFFTSEIKHRANQLSDLDLLPRILEPLPIIISQKYSGDITIVPPISVFDYRKLIRNPTKEWIQDCMDASEYLTWKTISRIRIHCDIERTLDENVKILRTLLFENPDEAIDMFRQKLN